MTFDLDNIKYLFQIPLSWFKAVSNRVFHAHGVNFIDVQQDEYGGMEIGINEDTFATAVLNVTDGGSGGGTVKSVDGISPDANGNVPLGAVRSINGQYYPDNNGNIEVGLGVASVNGIMPDNDGDVDLGPIINTINGRGPDNDGDWSGTIVETVNGKAPGANGNVEVGTVRGVDGVQPDANGNVLLGAVKTVNNTAPDISGNVDVGTVKFVNGIAPTSDGNVNISVGTVKTVNNTAPDISGNVDVGTVRSLTWGDFNTAYPDEDGDINIGRPIYSVDGIGGPDYIVGQGDLKLGAIRSINSILKPDANGNVNITIGTVKTVNNIAPDISGNVNVGTVRSVNNIMPDANGNADIGDVVYSVQGVEALDGDVDFNLGANAWVRTDAEGYLVPAENEPIVLSAGYGWMYNNNGTLSCRTDAVDLSSAQTIVGAKTFGATVTVDGIIDNDALTRLYGNGIRITGNATNVPHVILTSATNEGRTTFYRNAYCILYDTNRIDLNAPAGMVTLTNHPPATILDRKAVATVGWSDDRYVTLATQQMITGYKTFSKNVNLSVDSDRNASSRVETINRSVNIVDNTNNTFAELRATAYNNGVNGVIMSVQKPNAATEYPYYQLQVTPQGANNASIKADVMTLRQHAADADGYIQMRPGEGRVEIYPPTNTAHGGYLDFHYAGSTSDYTARLIDHQSDFSVTVPANKQIVLNASANYARLTNAPTVATTDKSSKVIATCGWTNTVVGQAFDDLHLNNYQLKADLDKTGNAASYNTLTAHYVTLDTAQTITESKTFTKQCLIKSGNDETILNPSYIASNNIYAINKLNGLAVAKISPDGTTGVLIGNENGPIRLQPSNGYLTLDAPANYARLSNQPNELNEESLAIATCGYVQQHGGGKVKSVDGIEPGEDGDVNFGLAPNSVVATDDYGHLISVSSGESVSKKVVSDVSWNGTKIIIKSETWTIENGLITSITSNADETISTVTYNP